MSKENIEELEIGNVELEEEELLDNLKSNTTTYHSARTGRFTSKNKAGSVSYGHYGSNPEAGKMAVKGGKPQITKHKCGAVATSKATGGGIGKNKYKCKDGTKVTEDLTQQNAGGLLDQLEALRTQEQRQTAALAKTQRQIADIETKLLVLKESEHRRALKLAGINESLVAEFFDNKQDK